MEIQFHTTSGVPAELQAAAAKSKAGAVESRFRRTEALEHALASEPAVRAEVVAGAELLLRARQYPPPELIGRISRLLGEHWEMTNDQ